MIARIDRLERLYFQVMHARLEYTMIYKHMRALHLGYISLLSTTGFF